MTHIFIITHITHTHKETMKKTYITPAVEVVSYSSENMMALSTFEEKANNGEVLSNRNGIDWDFEEE